MTTYTPVYKITHVNLIDVEKGTTIPGQTVTIAGERIDRIGLPAGPDVPERTQMIDGQGLYLMPGLVDAHVHYLDAPVFGRLMLANGVTLVRDMGMPNDLILSLRDALNRGDMLGPEMVAAGAILDGSPPLIPLISLGIETPEQGRLAVRQQAEAGVDFIKVYSRLDREGFLAILDEARQCGRKVVGHIPDTIYIEEAAAAGLASSEHFFGFEKMIARLLGKPVNLQYAGMGAEAHYFQRLDQVDPQALQQFYQRIHLSGMTVCPTVITFKVGTHYKAIQSGDFPHREFISPMVMGIWASMWAQQDDLEDYIWQNWAQMVKGLHQAGVPLMVGTDLMVPGIFPGYSVHEEMAVWQEAGIPPVDVLRSATLVPAQFMGLGDRLGSVREGKIASLVLVRANPLEDIRNAQQIESVFLRGQYFSREDLARLLQEAASLAQPPAAGAG
jgi:imidazolonepropionase-like amidohydrolase